MNKKLKRGLVVQFRLSRLHARPAGEVIKAIAVTVFWFGIVFGLREESLERPIVSCGFDGSHVLTEGAPMDVVRARASHRIARHVIQRNNVLVLSGVLVALVGDVDESGGIDVEGKLFPVCASLAR